MDELNLFLQKSANLFKLLTVKPEEVYREEYIEEIHKMLDEREEIIQSLKQVGFKYDENNSQHKLLYELDSGIKERLNKFMDEIKDDIKELNLAKQKEIQYISPYQDLVNREGRYYDGKK